MANRSDSRASSATLLIPDALSSQHSQRDNIPADSDGIKTNFIWPNVMSEPPFIRRSLTVADQVFILLSFVAKRSICCNTWLV